MSIRAKTIVLTIFIACIVVLTTFFVSKLIFMHSFEDLEKQKVDTDIERVYNALCSEINRLDTLNSDLAEYVYLVQQPEIAFQNAIRTNDMMANNKLNLIIMTNPNGNIEFSKAFNLETSEEIPLWPSLGQHLSDEVFIDRTNQNGNALGIVLLNEGPLMISSRPIISSEGQIIGKTIMGRFLDSTTVKSISNKLHTPLSLALFNDEDISSDFKTALSSLSVDKPAFTQTLNDKSIGGYILVSDIYEKPVLIVKMEQPRDIYAEGKTTMSSFFVLMIALGILFCIATLWLLSKLVISRLSRLSKDIATVGATGNLSTRLQNSGKDEVSIVVNKINDMLLSLEQSQHESRNSEEKLRHMFQSVSEGIILTDLKGNVLEANETLLRISGYSSEELQGIQAAQAISPKDITRAMEEMAIRRAESNFEAGEYTLLKKDGTEFAGEVSTSFIKDASGNPVAIISVIRDISKRKQIEKAIKESEARYRELAESITDIFFALDKALRYTYWNKACEKISGLSAKDVQGKYLYDLFPAPKDTGKAERVFLKVFETKKQEQFFLEYPFKDGDHTFGFNVYPSGDGISIFVKDITGLKRIEQALRESEAKYRTLFECTKEGISIVDTKGRIVSVNPAGAAILGYDSPQQLVGVSGSEIHFIQEQRKTISRQLRENGYAEIAELKLKKKDGTPVYVTGSSVARKNYSGTILQIETIWTDISKRKQAEEALKQSEEKLRLVFRSLEEGVTVADLQGNILEMNEAMLQITGYSQEEIRGKNAIELAIPEEYIIYQEQVKSLLAGNQPQPRECVCVKRDKTHFSGEIIISLLRNASGKATGLVTVTRDISERKKADEALKQSEEKLSLVFRSLEEGITVTDLGGNIIDVNEAVVQMHGLSDKSELIGRSTFEFISPESLAETIDYLKNIQDAKGDGHRTPVEMIFLRKDGTEFTAEVNASPLRDVFENPIGFVAIVRDITKRKQAEEALNQQNKDLTTLNNITQALSHPMGFNDVLRIALDSVIKATESSIGCIHLVDHNTEKLALAAQKSINNILTSDISQIHFIEEIANEAARTHKVVVSDTKSTDNDTANRQKTQLVISIPIKSKNNVLGVLSLIKHNSINRLSENIQTLETIGSHIGIAIENAQLLDKLSNLSVTDELTGLYNRRHFYQVLESEMARMQRYGRSFSLVMIDLDGFKQYNDRFGHTNGDNVLKAFAQTLKATLRKEDTAFRYGGDEFAAILVSTDAKRAKKIIERLRSKLAFKQNKPYSGLEEPLGFSAGIAQFPYDSKTGDGLLFLADTALYYSKRQGKGRSTLACDLGTASVDALSDIQLDQIYALAATVDARDPYTYGHSKRIATLCEMTGKVLGLPEKDIADLRAASLLHDIGKVGVPDSILSKPGKLLDSEFEVIQEHPEEGARIVSYIKALAVLAPYILHHHEWYDGNGYPKGLKGEDIPLGARIIAVADAYDAMTTSRPYKTTISQSKAFEELKRCSGTQFDPEMVEAFCQAVNKVISEEQERQLASVAVS